MNYQDFLNFVGACAAALLVMSIAFNYAYFGEVGSEFIFFLNYTDYLHTSFFGFLWGVGSALLGVLMGNGFQAYNNNNVSKVLQPPFFPVGFVVGIIFATIALIALYAFIWGYAEWTLYFAAVFIALWAYNLIHTYAPYLLPQTFGLSHFIIIIVPLVFASSYLAGKHQADWDLAGRGTLVFVEKAEGTTVGNLLRAVGAGLILRERAGVTSFIPIHQIRRVTPLR